MLLEEYYFEIENRFGTVKRARGNFLYTEKSVRLTDLYLENGRAVLGWGNRNGTTGTSAFLKIKNMINRGLTGSFETDCSRQLDKAVSALLNTECTAFIFFDKEKLHNAAYSLSEKIVTYVPWRNLVCGGERADDFECAVIVPPLPGTDSLYILAVKRDITPLFFSERISGALKAGLSRAIYDLIAELPNREEKHWFLYDTVLKNYFVRKGPYLYPAVQESVYDDFVRHCFDCHLALSPDYSTPSIVPFGADKGVFQLLKNNPWKKEL